MGLRFHRRRSIAKGFWIGVGKSGPSVGRRKGRFSASLQTRTARLRQAGEGGDLRVRRQAPVPVGESGETTRKPGVRAELVTDGRRPAVATTAHSDSPRAGAEAVSGHLAASRCPGHSGNSAQQRVADAPHGDSRPWWWGQRRTKHSRRSTRSRQSHCRWRSSVA